MSLLGGRNRQPLDATQQRRVATVFMGFDSEVPVRYEPDESTRFRIANEGQSDEYGEIVYGNDIYPGDGILDPNSTLSMHAAAAHEIAHYNRWKNLRELKHHELEQMGEIDEAMTSLEALIHEEKLSPKERKELASDAYMRLQMYVQKKRDEEADNT